MYQIVEIITLVLTGIAGVILTFITLPGTWLIVGAAVVLTLIARVFGLESGLNLWMILLAVVLGIVGEIVEFFASAVGAKRRGAGRAGAVGAVVGGLAGAIVCTFIVPIPLLGTFLGAILGAGVGAAVAERGVANKPWKDSASIGVGAAGGRLVATLIKTAIAAIIAVVLVTDSIL